MLLYFYLEQIFVSWGGKRKKEKKTKNKQQQNTSGRVMAVQFVQ